MLACLRCEQLAEVGGLCRAHADAIADCQQLTSEQIVSLDVDKPSAWLIDQWGCTHPLSQSTTIGRSPDNCQIALLHPSVSIAHARLELGEEGWRLIDLDSLNGTFHNGQRVAMTLLVDGDRLTFGQVGMYFTTSNVPNIAIAEGRGRTLRVNKGEYCLVLITENGAELELVQRAEGGLARANGAVVELARLEFGLLQCLVERSQQTSDPELCFVSWQELSRALSFKSRAADSENVRELVRRVRRKLQTADLPNLIVSRQGVGYRLAATVKSIGGTALWRP